MAPLVKATKADAVWRETWVPTPYSGEVDIAKDDETSAEHLVIRCAEVVEEFGSDARILNDGRTVGVAVGDQVLFGAVKRLGRAPIAVNIWRKPKKRKKRDVEAEDDRVAGTQGDGNEDNWQEARLKKSFRQDPDVQCQDDYTVLPTSLTGDLVGVVRNQSPRTGDYFIECHKIFKHYEKDAKIRMHEMPREITIGCAIVFQLDPPVNENNAPRATNIRRADDTVDAQDILQQARMRKGGKGLGKAPQRFGGIMRMVGLVKRPSPRTGRHFIFCQDISDVYGQDAQIPVDEIPADGLKVGDRISFDVEEPPEGHTGIPFARNVVIVGATGKAKPVIKQDPDDDLGDGEDDCDEDMQLEEMNDDEADLAEEKELVVDKAEIDEFEAENRAEAAIAKQMAAERSYIAKKNTPTKQSSSSEGDPKTTDGWIAAQERLFGDQPKLKPGWIRIRSKSTGKLYFYNTNTGESAADPPLR